MAVDTTTSTVSSNGKSADLDSPEGHAIVEGAVRAALGQQIGCTTPHSHLCDKPVANGMKTCDARMCDLHRVQVGPDRDYCLEHGEPELAARAASRSAQ